MKMSIVAVLCVWLCIYVEGYAQGIQTLRGRVYDADTHQALSSARVRLLKDTVLIQGVIADVDGRFRMDSIPVGRYSVQVKYPGYQIFQLSQVLVNSGKESVLEIPMEEMYRTLEEVVISGRAKDETNNEMSVNSAYAFQIEETERYAGSRSDAARMASNFAGVSGSDDSRNDISVRGNSPLGLLWRVEGVDLPNPNHFAVPGSTGGAISVLNNKVFGSSDFYTGAFPAEFGNATSGVFDIRMRAGNAEQHETSFQFGVLGTEIASEGPISKSQGSSYLFAYRYSTLKLFETVRLPIGTSAVPGYQDLSFKLNFPLKSKGILSVWGVSGMSRIRIQLSDKPIDEVTIYSESDWDQDFRTGMFVSGLTYTQPLGTKALFRSTLSQYGDQAIGNHHRFVRDSDYTISSYYHKVYFKYYTGKTTWHNMLNYKLGNRHTLRMGVLTDRYQLNYVDSNFVEPLQSWEYRNQFRGSMYMLQPYVQWKMRAHAKVDIHAGLHGQYWSLNHQWVTEPRLGVKWSVSKRSQLSWNAGLHSRNLPLYIHTAQQRMQSGEYELPNVNTGLIRSFHTVVGYSFSIKPGLFMRMEAYYQWQFQVPVDTFPSAFSLLNQGTSFTRYFPGALQNTGTGNNYGVEFTLSKSFAKSFYYLFTASIFESNYRGSDGIQRATDLNGRYIVNALFGKEFRISKQKDRTVITGIKVTRSGGRLYTPPDLASSEYLRELVELDHLRNTLRFPDYFRIDLKIGYRVNRPKVTHEFAMDIINVLNRQNVLGLAYVPDPGNASASPFREEYQLGLLPLLWYRLDF
jgi:hypothetical protein